MTQQHTSNAPQVLASRDAAVANAQVAESQVAGSQAAGSQVAGSQVAGQRTARPQSARPQPTDLAAKLLNDPRDYPFLRVMAQCAAVAALGVSLFFVPAATGLPVATSPIGSWPVEAWGLAFVYWLILGATVLDRFILMLHCTSHRRLFKSRYGALNLVIPWLLGPFCGESPESYFVHHLGMHHREENLEDDLSSTMKYRRDSFVHWLRYFGRFLLFGIFELAWYQYRRGNLKLMRRLLVGELSYWALILVLAHVDLWATLVVFVIPTLVVRALMMIGNWGQHAFVCQDEPENPYRNSITCINTRYNRRCFNDGYHIHHHVKARCHFSELPGEFEQNRATYGDQDAIVFDGVDFFGVWLRLMFGAHRSLARRLVELPGAPERSEAQRVEFLKSRLQAFKA